MQPKKLGPYQLQKMLGRGGMGAVYQGVHLETGDPAALKLLLDPFEEEEQLRERFAAEIETLKMLRHPHIVRLFAFGQEEGLLYYVMELVEGASLQQELRAGAVYSPKEVTQLGIEMCRALKHAHDRGIIHRDIKPANIMLNPERVSKLSDFGIARFFGSSHRTMANCVMGTLEYMPPEQAKAKAIGPKSDLYALGAVMYTLLLRRPPFQAKTLAELLKKQREGTIEPPRRVRRDIPEKLHSMILKMLEQDPRNRPANAYVARRRLQEILEDCFPEGETPAEKASSPSIPPAPYGVSAGRDPEKSPPLEGDPSLADSEQVTLDDPHRRLPDSEKIPESPKAEEKRKSSDRRNDHDTKTLHKQAHPRETADFSLFSPEEQKNETSVPSDDDEAGMSPPGQSGTSAEHDDEEKPPSRQEASSDEMTRTMSPEESPVIVNVGKDLDHLSLSEETHAPETLSSKSSMGDDRSPWPDGEESEASPAAVTQSSSFVEIQEEELGKVDQFESEKPPMVSVQVIVLSLCLLLTGFGVWYLLQPPEADDLYEKIEAGIASHRQEDYVRALRSREEEMRQFLSLFPNDPRGEELARYIKEIELANMQRNFERRVDHLVDRQDLLPVELAYLEAMETARLHPEKGIRKLRALIALYQSASSAREEMSSRSSREGTMENSDRGTPPGSTRPLAGPTEMCVELARRRLEALESMVEASSEEQREMIFKRLNHADELEASDPERARNIREAVIELYSEKDWAEEAVERAAENLGREDAPPDR